MLPIHSAPQVLLAEGVYRKVSCHCLHGHITPSLSIWRIALHNRQSLLIWSIVALSVVFTVTFAVSAEVQERTTVPLRFAQPVVNLEDGVAELSISECDSRVRAYQCPTLPYTTITLALPFTADDIDVELAESAIEELDLPASLELASAPIPLSDPSLFTPLPSPLYDESHWFPQEAVHVSTRCGRDLDDWQLKRFVSIAVFPVRYLACEGRVSFLSSGTLNVSYSLSGQKSTGTLGDGSCDVLIIAPDEFASELGGFVLHKNLLGIRTVLVTLEDVLAATDGSDDPEKVKQYIADHVMQNGTRFVLAVGDSNIFPVRYAEIWDGYDDYGNTTDGRYVPSDLYYSDLFDSEGEFSSWDTNGDGVYGESRDGNPMVDDVDMMPDVLFGRLPVESIDELAVMISQIADYELNARSSIGGDRVVLCGSEIFGPDPEGEVACQQLATSVFADYDVTRLFSTGTIDRDATLNVDNFVDYLDKGCRFLTNIGHGLYHSWYWGPTGSLSSSDIPRMNNQFKLPLVSAASCETGGFDNEDWNHPAFPTSDCIGECFVLQPGAAIGYAGATRVAYGDGSGNDWNDHFLARLNRELFGAHKNGYRTSGEMMAEAIQEYIDTQWQPDVYDVKTVMEYAFFGDPSLEIGGRLAQVLLPTYAQINGPKTAADGEQIPLYASGSCFGSEGKDALLAVAICSPHGDVRFYPNWTSEAAFPKIHLDAGFAVQGYYLTTIDTSIHCELGYNTIYIALLDPDTLGFISNLGGCCIRVE